MKRLTLVVWADCTEEEALVELDALADLVSEKEWMVQVEVQDVADVTEQEESRFWRNLEE